MQKEDNLKAKPKKRISKLRHSFVSLGDIHVSSEAESLQNCKKLIFQLIKNKPCRDYLQEFKFAKKVNSIPPYLD